MGWVPGAVLQYFEIWTLGPGTLALLVRNTLIWAAHRPSINLTLGEEWTAREFEEASTATCPGCGFVVELDTLVVAWDDVWRSP
jgi:hypothetical protein